MGDLSDQRRDYTMGGLSETDAPNDPWPLFDEWYSAAGSLYEPNAMVLATTSADGWPESRAVLLKSYDARGLVFFTQLDSAKGRALAHDARCAVLFPWFELQRQIRVTGEAAELPRDEVDAYFATRPRPSQLGAWASIEAGGQSAPVPDRAALDTALDDVSARFADEVPTPGRWGGYRIAVHAIEFWQGRQGRLHDRLRYTRDEDRWRLERLAP